MTLYTTSGNETYKVLRRVPKPLYPIQVYKGAAPLFSMESQHKVMKWTHERGYFLPDPKWLNPPTVDGIREIVKPIIESLGNNIDADISVDFLAAGGFNRVYTVHTSSKDYIFRTALPVDPYYKTESDVATTEIVRHFTSIPVPVIYAYDSSTDNTLGLEWILMEKIKGSSLDDTWQSMEFKDKKRLTEVVARWTAELSVHKNGDFTLETSAKWKKAEGL